MLHWFKTLVVFVVAFQVSSVCAEPFTYYPPGRLLKGSAVFGTSTGVEEYVVHAPDMLFPLKAPAFANSQVYGFGGNRYAGKDAPHGWRDDRNYRYPWRDNFCEERSDKGHPAYLCPSHWAHQGQDIRPTNAEPAVHEVVAVEDMTVRWMEDKYGGVGFLSLDRERRFHFLHMSRSRTVGGKTQKIALKLYQVFKKGEVIGFASQVAVAPTSVHLHFELLKVKRDENGRVINDNDGYAFVSPYWSLVAAYERLIGETGSMLAAPQVCTAEKIRCVPAGGIYPKAALITCSSDGTSETLTWCSGATCKDGSTCGTPTLVDMGGVQSSDLAPSTPMCGAIPVPSVTWTGKPPLASPPDFHFVTTAVAQGKLHVVGPGAAPHRAYDPTVSTWTALGPLPSGIVLPVIAAASKDVLYLYVLASDAPGVYERRVDGTWNRVLASTFWAMPSGKTASNDYVTYLLAPALTGPAQFYLYNPSGKYWGALAQRSAGMPSGLVYADTSVYAFGGADGAAVDRFDIVTNTWYAQKPLPSPIFTAATIGKNGLIWVAGGTMPAGNPTDSVRLYNPADDLWCEPGLKLPVAAAMPVLQEVSGKLYLLSDSGALYEGVVN